MFRRPIDHTHRIVLARRIRMRLALPSLLVAASGALLASPALAANQAVSVEDFIFIQARVAVKPGESVTWTTRAVAPHNVAFEDGQLIDPPAPASPPWTTMRTFLAEGSFRYYCQLHGGPGGSGMSGIVFVNSAGNVPPLAQLVVLPGSPLVGQPVSFSGSTSVDSDGTITQYEWDLDGNGIFETNTGSTPTASHSYATSGTFSVKVRVTDNTGATDVLVRPLRVNAPPTASFTATPNPGLTGGAVSFNGQGSSDSDGPISRYEWDLDGNGTLETNTGSTPTASRSYSSPGPLTVKLRVTDNENATAETTRSVQINLRPVVAPVLPGPPPTGATAPPPPSFAASKKTIAVSSSGRFSYSFAGRPGLAGTIALRSIAKVRVSARRRISLGTKSLTVPSSGTAKASWKLSRKNLRILKRNRSIKFRANVTLRNAAGIASSGAATLTLRRPTG